MPVLARLLVLVVLAGLASCNNGASQRTLVASVPTFPGAVPVVVLHGRGLFDLSAGQVLTAKATFDDVRNWYRKHLPAGSEMPLPSADKAVFRLRGNTITLTSQNSATTQIVIIPAQH